GILVGGSAVSQLVVVAASPAIARLYSPEDFGILAIYSSVLGFSVAAASLRYEFAIPLPSDSQEAADLASLSLLLTVLTTASLAIVLWIAFPVVAADARMSAVAPFLWLAPVGHFSAGIYKALRYWFTRLRRYTTL